MSRVLTHYLRPRLPGTVHIFRLRSTSAKESHWVYVSLLAVIAFTLGSAASAGITITLSAIAGVIFMGLMVRDAVSGSALAVTLVLFLGAVEPPRLAGVTVSNLGLAVCAAVLASKYLGTRTPGREVGFPIWTVLLVAVLLVSSSNLGALSALSTPLLTALTVFFIQQRSPSAVMVVLGAVGIFHAGIGLIESLTHTSVIYTGWKDLTAADVNGIRRAASLVGDPNYLGLTLLCCTPGIAFLSSTWRPPVKFIVWATYVAAFVLTFSRGAFLGAAVALCFYSVRKYPQLLRPKRLLAIALAAAFAIALASYSPVGQSLLGRFTGLDASTRSRSVLQSAALELFQDHWLTGLGLGILSQHLAPLAQALVPLNASGVSAFLPQTDPLNTYLLIGAEGGILGLILASAAILTAVFRSAKSAPLIAAVVLGIAITAATLDLIQSPIVWCVMILAINLPRNHRAANI